MRVKSQKFVPSNYKRYEFINFTTLKTNSEIATCKICHLKVRSLRSTSYATHWCMYRYYLWVSRRLLTIIIACMGCQSIHVHAPVGSRQSTNLHTILGWLRQYHPFDILSIIIRLTKFNVLFVKGDARNAVPH